MFDLVEENSERGGDDVSVVKKSCYKPNDMSSICRTHMMNDSPFISKSTIQIKLMKSHSHGNELERMNNIFCIFYFEEGYRYVSLSSLALTM